ncbi:DUF7846 domain-containing protein [Salinirussus salinus]|uniref:DUF7846 domain-containing protein n=1 Tax=Salinirussus salinus TaxID=1198300 RepID=UPI001F15A9DF|nr:glycosyltransferase family 39 protein [Salinirussus salinus]
MFPTRLAVDGGRLRTILRENRYRLLAGAVALAAGLAVFTLGNELLPYHSSNHDEGVYLQQAAMLLDGKLFLTPGSEPLREAFHPWFFVESERGLYPKYSPVPAAVFALGKLAGGYRLALGAVAAANVGLCYAVVTEAFDRPTGVLAAATIAATPLFLLTSAAFLPYAPTTALNLLFALAYVRSVRRADVRYAVLAGAAIGLAFFARPYTAVLFAAPFVAHALWHLWRAVPADRGAAGRQLTVAGVGLAFVGVALAYNAATTGSPLLFPFEAFAPLDGPGFGHRQILGHEIQYTPELALRANATVLLTLATDWVAAGPLGTAAALAGVGALAVGIRHEGLDPEAPLGDRRLRLVLLAVVPAVAVGNVYFWGNFNILGAIEDPTDGIISLFGPIYHFDLLLPVSAFAAYGVVSVARWLRGLARERVSSRTLMAGAVLCLAVTLPVVGAAQAAALGPPAEKHAAYTEKFEDAYAPVEEADFENALVFLPPEYGEWRNHPFQYLRNDPDFGGPAVYALARNPADDFAVLDAYPDRNYYRYRYQGEWTPVPEIHVVPVLERVRLHEGPTLTGRTRVTIPDRITSVSVAVTDGDTVRRYRYEGDPPRELTIDWTLAPENVTVDGRNLSVATGAGEAVPVGHPKVVALTVTLTEPSGGTLTYREEVLVRPTADGVEAVWPPESSVCTLVTECGLEGTYIPDRPDTRPSGIGTNTTLRDGNA